MVNVNYNLFGTFAREVADPVFKALRNGTEELTGEIGTHYQSKFAAEFITPYIHRLKKSDAPNLYINQRQLVHFDPSNAGMARLATEDQARQLLPEGSHLRTEWNAHYADGVKPEYVGRWDNIKIDSRDNNNLVQDYKAAEEMAFRLDQAGVPVKVTNDRGEEILQLLSQRPKD